MKKIISLFQRNYDGDRKVRNEVVPGAEWVAAGEGKATFKWNGTSCLIRQGKLYKRHDAKNGKTPPPDFIPAQDPDPVTGHWPGWLPVGDGPEDQWHREAWDYWKSKCVCRSQCDDTTWELIGPKVQGNPHKAESHILVRHGALEVEAPRNFDELRDWMKWQPEGFEGVVWHHSDGRMVKIKKSDFA